MYTSLYITMTTYTNLELGLANLRRGLQRSWIKGTDSGSVFPGPSDGKCE